MSAVAELPEETVYDTDFYAWTQQQAELLRRLRTTNISFPEQMDLDHIAEEIEDMGKSQLQGVESLVRNILTHLLKHASVPNSASTKHWRRETEHFLLDLESKYSSSMRHRIDMQRAWKHARRAARVDLLEYDDELIGNLPNDVPFSIEHLLAEEATLDTLLTRIHSIVDGNGGKLD